ncbi:MAG: N-acyl-D-glutamate amidohydrolase [Altererythrobacter sp. XM-24bin4]|jgi:N-acyl-D-aspartate/D-glutamate deacylase|uniref:N-acyl-D-amino-acid deacylase family protein n=1 Tax=uncultured Altererythrobacter sp. TaxID=500840 RepID=UPI000D797A33|nr:amidohydrolase family protein [uncultured Altererythrobacter sp.]PWL25772.1 MAG: N-acyl-D-glutamate amidohydrolase [Altererythrobacter sp. XM-24bin4]
MSAAFDIIIKNGRYFDGTGGASAIRNVGIKDGRIASVEQVPLDETGCEWIVDADGKWVVPGFIDTHTHYDAEVIVAPSLSESVRHGVTTVLMGSCSLSMICSEAEDASDIFTRVETVPREKVLPVLQEHKSWSTPKEWKDFVNSSPMGPNVIAFVGHSDMRVGVMGLHRATDRAVKPTKAELERMDAILTEALDEGYLGLSTMCLKWDKVDGDREWSKSLPSTYARWGEIARLNRQLRKRKRVHQGAPNAANPLQITQYLWETIGLWRRPLKTTLISMLDLKGNKTLQPLASFAAKMANLVRGNFRWQLLPTPFTVYADGIDVVFFEEFGAGEMALDLKEKVERDALLKDETYRRSFRKFYGEKLSPRVWQRDFGDAIVLECPDETLVGRNFAEIAAEREIHVVDLFLDLVVEHGKKLRWYTTVGNHNRAKLKKMVQDKNTLITFSDAGAHIRNMAFYNLPLRFLKLVKESHDEGKPIMSFEKAIWRMTGEQADWLNIEAGKIRVGDRADVAVIDPNAFEQDLEKVQWADMEGFGLERLVNRNPGLVQTVIINGKLAVEDEQVAPALGQEQGYGRFLEAA